MSLKDKNYKGTPGNVVLFMDKDVHNNLLWIEDLNGRKIYETDAQLCSALRVSKIVDVPYMENLVRTVSEGTGAGSYKAFGIKVNLKDYRIGSDKGGDITNFDDFDIDFNQYKYLMETRLSGMLTKYKGAQIFEAFTAAQGGNPGGNEDDDDEDLKDED